MPALWNGLPVLPQLTVSVQQWFDPGDTRLLESDLVKASELARSHGVPLLLMTYPEPKAHPEMAKAIQIWDRGMVSLNGLKTLDAKSARIMTTWRTPTISLNGLTGLDQDLVDFGTDRGPSAGSLNGAQESLCDA